MDRVCASLGRSKTCGFVRGKSGPRGPGGLQGAGERREEGDPPLVPGPWTWHGPAALALEAPGEDRGGGACSGGCRHGPLSGRRLAAGEASRGFLLFLARALHPESRPCRSGEQWAPGAFVPCDLSSHLVTARSLWPRNASHSAPVRDAGRAWARAGHGARRPAWPPDCPARFS